MEVGKKSNWILTIVSVIAVSIFPVVFLYAQNAGEVVFNEGIKPLLYFAGSGMIICFGGVLLTKNVYKGAIIAALFMLVFVNYSLLEAGIHYIFPSLKYWHILPIFIFILLHITYFIYKKVSDPIANNITKFIGVIFCGLICFNFILAVPNIVEKMSLKNEKLIRSIEDTVSQQKKDTHPNVYFLIFDEYASFYQMEKYYDYDNSELKKFLEDSGFTISYDSHNESIMTSTITANLVNLDYVANNMMTEAEKSNLRHNGALFKLMKDQGYIIKGVGEADFYGMVNAAGETESSTKTISGNTFFDLLVRKTLLYPFYQGNSLSDTKKIFDSMEYIGNPDNFSESEEFTIMHIFCPHTPFLLDVNGKAVPYKHYIDWKNKKYYLEQYQYITKLMIQAINSIVESDPNSVIILQSDHGARASTDKDLSRKMFELNDMNHILNAVYYQGDLIPEINNQSGVNTLRLTLNKLFDLNLEILEVPEDDYDNYKENTD